jgi:hypothetical protein
LVRKIGPNTRYVKTAEGAAFYGQPIGSPITPDIIKKKNREAASIGITPPKGAVEDAAGKPVKSAEVARPAVKVSAPQATGPSAFKIGNSEFGVAEGSRIFQPKSNPGIRYIMEPDGTIRAFNRDGEAEVPETLAGSLRDRFENFDEGDARYEELQFDGTAPTSEEDVEEGAEAGSPGGEARAESASSATGKWKKQTVSYLPPAPAGTSTKPERAQGDGFLWSTDERWGLVKSTTGKGYDLFHAPTGLGIRRNLPRADAAEYAAGFATLPPLSIDKVGEDFSTDSLGDHKRDIQKVAGVTRAVAAGSEIPTFEDETGSDAPTDAPAPSPETANVPAPSSEDSSWSEQGQGDVVSESFVRQAPTGSQVMHFPTTGKKVLPTMWTKNDDGTWSSNKSSKMVTDDQMVSALGDNVLIARVGPEAPEDSALYPGAPDFSTEDLQAAYDSLLAHPGFQIAYGLPQDSPLRGKDVIGALTTAARAERAGLSPKQAVLAHLRAHLGIEEPPADAPTDEPQITVGAAEPKRTGVQGFNGGQFTRADIQEAVDILEAFQGKAFKSELNKKGNALGTLDPASMVGIEKDKTIAKQKFVDYLRGILDANPPADASTSEQPPAPENQDRTPEEIVGTSPESVSEIESLPAGTLAAYFARVYAKNEDGTWSQPGDTESTPLNSEDFAYTLRGFIVTALPEQGTDETPDADPAPEPEAETSEFGERLEDPADFASTSNIGDSLTITRPDGSRETLVRIPDEGGQRAWRTGLGFIQYDKDLFFLPGENEYFGRRAEAPADSGGRVEEPPAPSPEPAGPAFAPGQNATGADVESMVDGTRLIYTRKDGRTTAYTVRLGGRVLVTDRGTEVAFDRVARMKFLVYSVPGAEQPPTSSNAPVPAPQDAPRIGDTGVGDRVPSRYALEEAPVGSQVVDLAGASYTKTSPYEWRNNVTGEAFDGSSVTSSFRRELTWAHIPEKAPDTPWVAPEPSPTWTQFGGWKKGDFLTLRDMDRDLESLPVLSYVSLQDPEDREQNLLFSKDPDGRWSGQSVFTGEKISPVDSTTLRDIVLARHAKVEITRVGLAHEQPGAGSKVLFTDVESARIGDVFLYRDPRMRGREVLFQAVDDEAGGIDWISNVPDIPFERSATLLNYARYGHLYTANAEDFDRPFLIMTADEFESQAVGTLVRAGSGYFIREEGPDGPQWVAIPSRRSGDYRQPVTSNHLALLAANSTFTNRSARTGYVLRDGAAETIEPVVGAEMSPFDLQFVPRGTRVETATGVFVSDGNDRWTREDSTESLLGETWDSLGIQYPVVRVLRVGREEASPASPNTTVPYEDMIRYPVGSRFRVGGIRSGEWTVIDDRSMTDGRQNYAFGIFDRDDDATFEYIGRTDMSAVPEIGSAVPFPDQMRSLPVGAFLTSASNVVSVQKVGPDSYAVVRDRGRTSSDGDRYENAEDLLSNMRTTLTYDRDAHSGEPVTADSSQIGSAHVGAIVVNGNDLRDARTLTESGWETRDGNPVSTEELRTLLGEGTHYFQAKRTPASKYVTAGEIAIAKPGTAAYLRLPKGADGHKTKRLVFNGTSWLTTDGKDSRYAEPREFTTDEMLAAAARGDVKITSEARPRLDHEEYVQAVQSAETPADALALARAQHPRVRYRDWDFRKTERPSDRVDKMQAYREFLIETARQFDNYPELQSVRSIGGENSTAMAFAWVNHRVGATTIDTSSMTMNMKWGKWSTGVGYRTSQATNHFHGVPRRGITPAMQTVTHEFGHLLDTNTGMTMGAVAKRAEQEFLSRYPAGPERDAVQAQTSKYAQTNSAELVAESIENWTNGEEVEPITEHIVAALQEHYRVVTGNTRFEFKKNPGRPDAPINFDPNKHVVLLPGAHSMGSLTAREGLPATVQELRDVPEGTTVRIAQNDEIWTKEKDNTWRKPNGFVDTLNEPNTFIQKERFEAGIFFVSITEPEKQPWTENYSTDPRSVNYSADRGE